jgi:Peptidyl-prolyl cis-trans isomerase (rotamase) - cyclophilin family
MATASRFGLVAALALTAACGGKSADSPAVPAGPAPDSFRVTLETSRGPVVVEALRRWAPNGVDRFHALVQNRFFDENRFFRVVPGFIVQFGLAGDPKANERWDDKPIPDDPLTQSNLRGTVTFATEGPNTRTHQLFINLADNPRLDKLGFTPIGRVVSGMAAVDSIYPGYEEDPSQQMIQRLGNSYLARMFPKLDYIKTVRR